MNDKRTPDRRRGYGEGKGIGARFRGQFGPVTAHRTGIDDLQSRLTDLLVSNARGSRPTAEAIEEVRGLAVRNRTHDWAGVSLGAVATLWHEFGDAASGAWLPVMLAEAGRFEDAAALPRRRVAGGPPAFAEPVVATALWALGREDEARDRMTQLVAAFPDLDERFISAWGTDARADQFRALRRAADPEVLPVFFHLPFSGGTSMIVSLKRTIPWARMIEINRRFGELQVERALQYSAQDLAPFQMVHQHHPFGFTLPGRRLSYFTVLRDPVSQIRSGYFKRQASEHIIGTRDNSPTFDDHIAYTVENGLTNMLSRQLVTTHPEIRARYAAEYRGPGAYRPIADEEDMYWLEATADLGEARLERLCRETLDEQFHLVGTMKHLAASHLAAVASVGVPVAERVGHQGKSGQPKERVEEPASIVRLREANAVDQLLYEEYTARFEKEHDALIDAVERVQAVENA
ncbi:hypothetical protein ACIG47_10025 [Promicromonospora sp. NPDC052451]|uniref:hypothetical protein n=1 Tax=unclassified Promicromonospora TaxID=2647929 RepID=UPI0037C80899